MNARILLRRLPFLAVLALAGEGALAANHPCDWQAEPEAQARCLLRPVGYGNRLGEDLARLPAALAGRVGQAVEPDLRARLAAYLARRHIAARHLGGELARPVSEEEAKAPVRYFVIHDTSWPQTAHGQRFPPKGVNRARWPGNRILGYASVPEDRRKAHVFINRLGESVTAVDFAKGWRATKYEMQEEARRGLMLHVELVQPRQLDRHGVHRIAPLQGFSAAQYERLALVYAAASVRNGRWLVPAFHAAVDAGIPRAHDDPRNFSLERWSKALARLFQALERG